MKHIPAAILMLVSVSANAVDFDLAIGHTTFNPSDNGTWWQRGLPHHFETDSNSIGFGFSDYLSKDVRWRVGYQHLGSISSWAIATSDADFTGNGCRSTPCELNDVFIGHGSAQGIVATLAPEYKVGKFKLFVEGGFWVYQAQFNMVVIGPGRNSITENSVFWNRDKDGALQVRPVIGVGIEYDKTQLVLTGYGVDSSGEAPDTIPNYQSYAINASIRRMF